jgi:N-acetylglucosamine-6-phosphate deacetylase
MKQAFLADEIFTGSEMLAGFAILTDDNIVKAFLLKDSIPADYGVQEFPGCMITPAFIDLQLYGGNGKLFSHSLDIAALEATHAYCVSGGCSRFMITMATNSMENFIKGIDVTREYIASGKKGLLGIHLEGPWISKLKRGAHVEAFIKKPTRKDIEHIIENGSGIVKMITLAPEECDEELVQMLMDNGILISAGHSNATYAQAARAFESGVPAATHLFNAMSPLQGREPGMVGAIYDDPNVMSSIICDGVHVDFASVRISKKIMGERLFFITDAVTSIDEGYYKHVFKGDRYTLPDGTLSGSCMTMASTFKNAVQKAGISVVESLKMCSTYPAGLLKDPFLGNIKVGQLADFNIVDKKTLDLAGSVFY